MAGALCCGGREISPHSLHELQVYIADGHLVVVVELASQGELFSVLSGGPVPEDTARHLFRQLVAAVSYCHGAHVVRTTD